MKIVIIYSPLCGIKNKFSEMFVLLFYIMKVPGDLELSSLENDDKRHLKSSSYDSYVIFQVIQSRIIALCWGKEKLKLFFTDNVPKLSFCV